MMDGFEAYKYSMAIKMHFSGSYDAIKYRYKTRVTQKSYWGRSDKYQLTKIGKRFNKQEDIVQYFVAHNLNDTKWVGDMVRDEKTYSDHIKKIESLSYNVKTELEELSEYSLDGLLGTYKGNYPIIINKYLEETVSIETVCVLNSITSFIEDADRKITETILWPDIYKKVTKYQPFLNINKDKFKKIILNTFK